MQAWDYATWLCEAEVLCFQRCLLSILVRRWRCCCAFPGGKVSRRWRHEGRIPQQRTFVSVKSRGEDTCLIKTLPRTASKHSDANTVTHLPTHIRGVKELMCRESGRASGADHGTLSPAMPLPRIVSRLAEKPSLHRTPPKECRSSNGAFKQIAFLH